MWQPIAVAACQFRKLPLWPKFSQVVNSVKAYLPNYTEYILLLNQYRSQPLSTAGLAANRLHPCRNLLP